MAQLPNSDYLINTVGNDVIIFHRYTEDELVRFNVNKPDEVAKAQKTIHELEELDPEDKSFAHFWSGYFYAHLGSGGIG